MQNDDEWLELSLKKLNVSKLKKKCDKLGLSSKGTKKELIGRIMGKVGLNKNKNDNKNDSEQDGSWMIHNESNYQYKPSFSCGVYGSYPSIVYNQNNQNNHKQQKEKEIDKDKIYTKPELQQFSKSDLLDIIHSFSKSEIINIIIQRQNRKQKKVDDALKQRNAHKDETKKVFTNPHERNIKPVKFGEKMATDYEKIEKQRVIIRQLKEKRKNQNDLKARNQHRTNNLFSSAHEKVIKHKEIKHPPKKKKDKNNGNKEKIMDPVSSELIQKRQEVKDTLNQTIKENDVNRKEIENELKDNNNHQSDFDREMAKLIKNKKDG